MRTKIASLTTVLTTVLAVALFLAFAAGPLFAEIPKMMQYQGKLTDSGGNPLNGNYKLTFRIYDAQSGGNLKWSEAHSAVTISNGIFSILLGGVDPAGNPLNLPFDKHYWLSIQVGDDIEMTPRQRLASVGYAYKAATADSLSGGISIPYYIYGFELEWINGRNVQVTPGAVDIAGTMYTTTEAPTLDIGLDSNWITGMVNLTTTWVYLYVGAPAGTLVYKFSNQTPLYSDTSNGQYRPKIYIKDGTNYYRCIGVVRNDASSNIVSGSLASWPISNVLGVWDNTPTRGTAYLAATDGFVCAYQVDSGNSHSLIGYSDGSNPPTTIRAKFQQTNSLSSPSTVSIMFPVRKGDYWKVDASYEVYEIFWLPLYAR